ncbi:hypothetical protein B1759_04265 [Rubrivirga sp. SAORIC476]|uniref:hypothetical protein n=1 Tax=Rubrivirga sp. SAORIC476 TaxID=1961794 RepID=UPI000BA960FC|nr:hypothetical protein [Rubrivirga sp. SAORIC476]PAP80601.1 hypothetical protein B1759_04265 [Rubrivirga sp. SAORIC476]
MIRLTRTFAFVAILALSVTACDTAGPDAASSASPALAQSAPSTPYMVFSSQAAFDEAYQNQAKLSADQASATIPSGGTPSQTSFGAAASFLSMAGAEIADVEALERGEIKEEQVRVSIVEDTYLASMLSPTGVIQIGSAVYKIGETKVFSGTTASVADFNTKTEAELGSRYESAPIQRTTTASSASAFQLRCSSAFSAGGKSYKTCGTSFITNWPWVLHSAGASTKVLKKWWFLYLPTKGDALVLTGTHRVVAGGGALPAATTVTHTASNSYILLRIYKAAAGGSDFRGTVSATHRGTEGGVQATTSTSVSLP